MKKFSFLIILFLGISNTVFSQIVEEAEEVIVHVEEQPSFPGGEAEMVNFIRKNLRYPEMAKEASIMGKVYIEFVVDKDGSITNVVCKRGIGGGCDEEAVRVIKSMPKWMPGKQNGRPVKVKFILPIQFKIN